MPEIPEITDRAKEAEQIARRLSEIEDLLQESDRLRSRQTLVSGDMKDAGSPFRSMTPQEREYLQALVMDMYDQFVTEVANSRNLPVEKVRAVADGRALTGRQAHELGLVDALGGMDMALTDLQQLCGIAERPVLVEQPKPSSWLRDALETVLDLQPASRVITPGFLYVY